MTGRLDRWERLLERQMAAAPYVLLVISAALSLLTGGSPWVTSCLAALAAAWMWLVPRGVAGGAVYVAGLVVLIGALCTQGAWFASFFGFTGYLHSWQYLRGNRRFVGVTATAAISVASYSGGLPGRTPSAILTYLLFSAAIVAGVSLFSFVGEVTAERSTERKHMVARLEEALRENTGLQAQ